MAKKDPTDLSVEEKLKTLYQMQTALSAIDEKRTLRGELPQEVDDLEDEIEGLNTRIQRIQTDIDEFQKAVAQKKGEIAEAEASVARYKAQLDDVKNNREYDTLSKEIEFQSLEIELCNKKIREAQARISEKSQELEQNKQLIEERRGDLDLWLKARIPFDDDRVFGLAAMFDFYIPTGETSVGMRPRHAWYLNDQGVTHPFTADAFAVAGTLVMTLDFSKVNVPIRWNGHAGFVYATGDGQANTFVYGTGLNWLPLSWMDVFAEFSGEFRVEETGYPRDPMDDPMLITPGLRFHLPWGIDFAMGLDVAVRALKNFRYDYKKEMKNVDDYTIHYMDEKGHRATYGYVPTPLYAGTAALTVRFGDRKKDSDGDGVEDKKDSCA